MCSPASQTHELYRSVNYSSLYYSVAVDQTLTPAPCMFIILQVWINQGDIILIGLRDYQDTKADVIIRYTPDEARNLKTYGELPESSKVLCVALCMYLQIFKSVHISLAKLKGPLGFMYDTFNFNPVVIYKFLIVNSFEFV